MIFPDYRKLRCPAATIPFLLHFAQKATLVDSVTATRELTDKFIDVL